MVDFVITFAAGAASGMAVGVALEKFVFAKMKADGIQSRADALKAYYGEPMSATTLTFAEVKDWIMIRKDQLANDAKAAVVKVDKNTMRSLGQNLDTRGVENYLVLVIMTENKQITDSLLVKYDKLDKELENALAKGNGILVVKG